VLAPGIIRPPDGPTTAEGLVKDKLVEDPTLARLLRQHPDELHIFVDAMHFSQQLLTVRMCRGALPHGWPTEAT
jgi:hypothetical protein